MSKAKNGSKTRTTTVPVGQPTFQWAVQQFHRVVQELFDDPTGVVQDGTIRTQMAYSQAVRKTVDEYVGYANDFGLDFWAIAKKESTKYEIHRLKEILAGTWRDDE